MDETLSWANRKYSQLLQRVLGQKEQRSGKKKVKEPGGQDLYLWFVSNGSRYSLQPEGQSKWPVGEGRSTFWAVVE